MTDTPPLPASDHHGGISTLPPSERIPKPTYPPPRQEYKSAQNLPSDFKVGKNFPNNYPDDRTMSGATASSASLQPYLIGNNKDMSYNSRHNSISDPQMVSNVYRNIEDLAGNKMKRSAGAPSWKGIDPSKPGIMPDDPSFYCRFPPSGPQHPEWMGSIPDKWCDPNSGRYMSRKIVNTAVRNGAEDSFTRNGFNFSHQAYTNPTSKRQLQSWMPDGIESEWKCARRRLLPPHIVNKEQIESCKWTKKPAYIGKYGVGADRPSAKEIPQRTQSEPRIVEVGTSKLSANDKRSRMLVRNLSGWEKEKLRKK